MATEQRVLSSMYVSNTGATRVLAEDTADGSLILTPEHRDTWNGPWIRAQPIVINRSGCKLLLEFMHLMGVPAALLMGDHK